MGKAKITVERAVGDESWDATTDPGCDDDAGYEVEAGYLTVFGAWGSASYSPGSWDSVALVNEPEAPDRVAPGEVVFNAVYQDSPGHHEAARRLHRNKGTR